MEKKLIIYPTIGTTYYYHIFDTKLSGQAVWRDDNIDRRRYEAGNCFLNPDNITPSAIKNILANYLVANLDPEPWKPCEHERYYYYNFSKFEICSTCYDGWDEADKFRISVGNYVKEPWEFTDAKLKTILKNMGASEWPKNGDKYYWWNCATGKIVSSDFIGSKIDMYNLSVENCFVSETVDTTRILYVLENMRKNLPNDTKLYWPKHNEPYLYYSFDAGIVAKKAFNNNFADDINRFGVGNYAESAAEFTPEKIKNILKRMGDNIKC
jgi:hypothetical protein